MPYLERMAHFNFIKTLFSDDMRARQEKAGSRASYARAEAGVTGPDVLGEKEEAFIALRDSFYMASITENGWPYVQHRGGPAGFLKMLPGNRLAFADYQGNKQYLSTSNLAAHPRVALIVMDYPNRRRLKVIGTARLVELDEDPALVTSLMTPGYKAVPERAFVIDVIGLDWNCPQHITSRFTEEEVKAGLQPMIAELHQLRAEVERLRALLPVNSGE